MNFGFWKQLPQPFTVLAPLSGYTDASFRGILAKYGKPDVMFTEFVPVDGLCSRGRDNLARLLQMTAAERPIVVQLYGGNPDNYMPAAEFVSQLGFAGIDINMGCPARMVEQRLGGSALIKDPARAKEIIAAAKAGAGQLPVSVKTRIGYHESEIESWLACLLATAPAALILHARTRMEAYDAPARWDAVANTVALAAELQPDPQHRPLIIGNGDIRSLAQAQVRAAASNCAGVMVGRGVIGNPWFFNQQRQRADVSPGEVLAVMLEHTRLYLSIHGPQAPLEPLKKHYKAYVNGLDNAPRLRASPMRVTSYAQVEELVRAAQADCASRTLHNSGNLMCEPSLGCES